MIDGQLGLGVERLNRCATESNSSNKRSENFGIHSIPLLQSFQLPKFVCCFLNSRLRTGFIFVTPGRPANSDRADNFVADFDG